MMDILDHLNQPPGQLVDWAEGEEGRTGERSVGEALPGGTRERGFSQSRAEQTAPGESGQPRESRFTHCMENS